jgi:cob(I)alamin adenosyltransferase
LNDKEHHLLATGTVKLVLTDAGQEEARLNAIVAQTIAARNSLFLGRFLSDLLLPDAIRSQWARSRVALRQYGYSCHVNAPPLLADIGRAEIGLEEAEAALRSGVYEVVLLSQILTAVDADLLTTRDVQSLCGVRPQHVTLILTGRNAPTEIAAECEHY